MAGLELLSDQGYRVDGRRAGELRKIQARMGVFAQADGSAYIEQGNTKALAVVYGPHEASGRAPGAGGGLGRRRSAHAPVYAAHIPGRFNRSKSQSPRTAVHSGPRPLRPPLLLALPQSARRAPPPRFLASIRTSLSR